MVQIYILSTLTNPLPSMARAFSCFFRTNSFRFVQFGLFITRWPDWILDS